MKDLKKSQKRNPNNIDEVSFLFKLCNKDIKLAADTGKSFDFNRTKYWESVSYTLDLGEFSCTATRFDSWFKEAGEQQFCHERRHQVKWDYRGDKHSIGSYDIGPLLPLIGENRPKRAGVIFAQVAELYNQKRR